MTTTTPNPTDARLSAAYLAYLAACATGSQAKIEAALLRVQRAEQAIALTQHLQQVLQRVLRRYQPESPEGGVQ